MKKNLYSLTLSDDVVREVDALAHRMGTNRQRSSTRFWPSTLRADARAPLERYL